MCAWTLPRGAAHAYITRASDDILGEHDTRWHRGSPGVRWRSSIRVPRWCITFAYGGEDAHAMALLLHSSSSSYYYCHRRRDCEGDASGVGGSLHVPYTSLARTRDCHDIVLSSAQSDPPPITLNTRNRMCTRVQKYRAPKGRGSTVITHQALLGILEHGAAEAFGPRLETTHHIIILGYTKITKKPINPLLWTLRIILLLHNEFIFAHFSNNHIITWEFDEKTV